MGNNIEKGVRIGCYRIVRPLRDGGMGRVYEVEHADLGVRRAMKVFAADAAGDSECRERFFAEARILAGLDHPRIVRIHDFAADDGAGVLYFTMDLVLSRDGTPRNLADPRCFGRSERTVAGWFADLCEGLDYVHSRSVVHGDVKLENALVGPDGRAVLADFGLSRLLGGVSAPFAPGDPSFIAGTLGYLPPETTGSDATPATDAWALGVAAYRLVTGFWFDETDREGCLSLLDDCDLPWKDVLGRLLSDDPSARIPADGLSALSRTIADAAEPPVQKGRSVRRSALLAASVALVAAFGAGVWFAASPRPAPSPAPDVPAECGEPGVLALPCPNPSAHRWDDRESNGYAALDETIILANLDKFPPEVAEALRHALDRAISFYGYRRFLPPQAVSCLDRWLNEMATDGQDVANPAQLLLVAGEAYRQRLLRMPTGEFREDVERLAGLAMRFHAFVVSSGCDPEWAYETVLSDVVNGDRRVLRLLLEAYARKSSSLGSIADPWLLLMARADCAMAEADFERRGRLLEELDDGDRARYEAKRTLAGECLFTADQLLPRRNATASRLLALSIGHPDETRRRFAECMGFRFDDLHDWGQCAWNLLPHWGGGEGDVESLLDLALAEGTEDSWLPAFYVLGRWRILAPLGRRNEPYADADHRGWAYEDADMRAKTLSVMRRFADSEVLKGAPEMRRSAVLVNFAAVALVCDDEPLARELVSRMPNNSEVFHAAAIEAAEIGTQSLVRLERMFDEIQSRGGSIGILSELDHVKPRKTKTAV